jgi:hypothetical protein
MTSASAASSAKLQRGPMAFIGFFFILAFYILKIFMHAH